MTIAVDTDDIWNGTNTSILFALELLARLPALLPEHRFVFHSDAPREHDWGDVKVIDRFADASADTYLAFSLGYFADIPGASVLFDIDDQLVPKESFWNFLGFKKTQDAFSFIKREPALIVPHLRLKNQLTQAGVPADKVTVVGYGQNPKAIRPADPVTRRITKEVYGNEHSYFLAPSTGHVSDNLERLFAAYDLFRARCPEPVRLLVQSPEYGTKQPRAVRNARKKATYADDIVLLPKLSEHEYRKVFASARALLFPSLSTRFPLPVLDAWSAEVPVLHGDNDILRGAGALVQGEDVKSIAEGMVALVTTPFLASGLVENGKRRLADFSWDGVAERVAGVLSSVVEASGG